MSSRVRPSCASILLGHAQVVLAYASKASMEGQNQDNKEFRRLLNNARYLHSPQSRNFRIRLLWPPSYEKSPLHVYIPECGFLTRHVRAHQVARTGQSSMADLSRALLPIQLEAHLQRTRSKILKPEHYFLFFEDVSVAAIKTRSAKLLPEP